MRAALGLSGVMAFFALLAALPSTPARPEEPAATIGVISLASPRGVQCNENVTRVPPEFDGASS